MKDLICFLIFLIYSTVVFFFPNNDIILFFIVINLILFFIIRKFCKFILSRNFCLIPFVLFTFYNAVWVGVKLIIVCNVTMIYSCTTSVAGVANTIKLLFSPLSFIGIDTEQIRIMVCISLSMIPIFKRDLYELRDTCVSKGIRFSVSNVKFVVSKFFFSILQMVSKIERALLAKGIDLS